MAKSPGLRLEIVKRSDDMKGFVVLPRRWVVERTFSWFGRNRRLAKDYENLAATLAAFVTLAAIQFGLRRLARAQAFESGSNASGRSAPNRVDEYALGKYLPVTIATAFNYITTIQVDLAYNNCL